MQNRSDIRPNFKHRWENPGMRQSKQPASTRCPDCGCLWVRGWGQAGRLRNTYLLAEGGEPQDAAPKCAPERQNSPQNQNTGTA